MLGLGVDWYLLATADAEVDDLAQLGALAMDGYARSGHTRQPGQLLLLSVVVVQVRPSPQSTTPLQHHHLEALVQQQQGQEQDPEEPWWWRLRMQQQQQQQAVRQSELVKDEEDRHHHHHYHQQQGQLQGHRAPEQGTELLAQDGNAVVGVGYGGGGWQNDRQPLLDQQHQGGAGGLRPHPPPSQQLSPENQPRAQHGRHVGAAAAAPRGLMDQQDGSPTTPGKCLAIWGAGIVGAAAGTPSWAGHNESPLG